MISLVQVLREVMFLICFDLVVLLLFGLESLSLKVLGEQSQKSIHRMMGKLRFLGQSVSILAPYCQIMNR